MRMFEKWKVGRPTLRLVAMLLASGTSVHVLGACSDRKPLPAQQEAERKKPLCSDGGTPLDGGAITYMRDGGFNPDPLCVHPGTQLTFTNHDPVNAITLCFKRYNSDRDSPFKDDSTLISVPGDGGSLSKQAHDYRMKKSHYQFKKSADGGCTWDDDSVPGPMTGTVEVGSGGGMWPPDPTR